MSSPDTIVAIATPPGRGGIGVVRVSGNRVKAIATAVLGALPQVRYATLRSFRDQDGVHIDTGLAILFCAPNSFTGEDVLELHAHGGPMLMDMLLTRVLQLGARLAAPGEFSLRAFLNEKLDLIQAEAIADLIDSGSQQAARAAMRSLQGEFSIRMHEITELLIGTRMYVEAAIDFPEEEVDFLGDAELHLRFNMLTTAFDAALARAQQGSLLRDGMTVVIAGKPNAGKSSLLNALAGYEAAIVTPIPGTTRDVLRERITIDGMPLHVIDTAGLRDTDDVIESEGIKRAHKEMNKADRILYVIDSTVPMSSEELARERDRLPADVSVTMIYNKIDLMRPELSTGTKSILALSAETGEGIPELHRHLRQCAGLQESSTTTFSARRRHLDALMRARQHVQNARQLLEQSKSGELTAEELRLAQNEIGEITGKVTSDDLLGKIFSSFCIGK